MFKSATDRQTAERLTAEYLEDLSPNQRKALEDREKEEQDRAEREDYFKQAFEWAWDRAGREAA